MRSPCSVEPTRHRGWTGRTGRCCRPHPTAADSSAWSSVGHPGHDPALAPPPRAEEVDLPEPARPPGDRRPPSTRSSSGGLPVVVAAHQHPVGDIQPMDGRSGDGQGMEVGHADGPRITGFLTNTGRGGPCGQLADLELRYRATPGRGPDPGGEGHWAAQPALPRHRPEPHLGRHHRPRLGPAGLVRAARATRLRRRLRTQTATAADPRHRRAARAHRTPPRAAHRLDLALGRDDHHRTCPPLRPARPLTRSITSHDPGSGAPADTLSR